MNALQCNVDANSRFAFTMRAMYATLIYGEVFARRRRGEIAQGNHSIATSSRVQSFLAQEATLAVLFIVAIEFGGAEHPG